MRRLLLIAAVIAYLPTISLAQEPVGYKEVPPGRYTLDKTHASLTWKVMHMGMANYTARFKSFDATLDYNNEDPTLSKLSVTVDPLSVETDYPNSAEKDFNKELATGETWFNAAVYPEIKFVSTAIEMTSENAGTVTGDLTFMGVTKPLTLDVVYNGGYPNMPMRGIPAMGFSASTVLKRSEWGLNTYIPMIGDDVELMIEAEFHKIPAKEEE